MKSRKRNQMEEIELSNKEKIKTFEEKAIYKYLGI